MIADRAAVRRLCSDHDMPAVAAFPYGNAGLFEDLHRFHILQQLSVALFMMLFNGSHAAELLRQFMEAFFIRFPGKTVIHVSPLIILAFRGVQQVLLCIAQLSQRLEPELRVLLLIFRGLEEESRDLFVTVLFRDRSEIGVLVAGLAFSCESGPEILFGAGAGVGTGGFLRGSLRGNLNLFKIGRRVLADRADEIFRKFFPDILIAADPAAPDYLSVLRHAGLLRSGLDILLIVGISDGRIVGQLVHIRYFGNKEDVGAKVHRLAYFGGNPGIGSFRNNHRSVFRPAAGREVSEFVHVPS